MAGQRTALSLPFSDTNHTDYHEFRSAKYAKDSENGNQKFRCQFPFFAFFCVFGGQVANRDNPRHGEQAVVV